MQSIYELDLQAVVNDVKKGQTCVLMKPRGMKIMVSSPPNFDIADKKFRSLSILDLLSTDLCIDPYMHFNKIKSKLVPDESYEVVYNYDQRQIYLTSIRENRVFVNDYRVMFSRASQYDIAMPSIPTLDVDGLVSLITEPDEYFTKLEIADISDAVMFLNEEYQGVLNNPHKLVPKKPTDDYIKLVKAIIQTRPDSLSEGMNHRFIEIWNWCVKARNTFSTDVQNLGMPAHMLTLQDFTLTFLPGELYKFLMSEVYNVAIFRLILLMISGKGYTSCVSEEDSKRVKALNAGLNWTI